MTIEHDEYVDHYDDENYDECLISSMMDMLSMRNVLSRTTTLRNIVVLSSITI